MKGSKDSYYSLESIKTSNHYIGSVGSAMTSSKNRKTYPTLDVNKEEPQVQNFFFFYSILQDFTSLYRVWKAVKLILLLRYGCWKFCLNWLFCLVWNFLIFAENWFLAIICAPDMLESNQGL